MRVPATSRSLDRVDSEMGTDDVRTSRAGEVISLLNYTKYETICMETFAGLEYT